MDGLEIKVDEEHKMNRPLVVVAAAAGLVGSLALLRRQYARYAAERVMKPERSTFRARLADHGLTGAEEVQIRANDGVTLRGRFFAAYAHRGNLGGAMQQAKATIILLHGYAANHNVVLNYVALLVAGGYNVLAYDLRGHGQSDGAHTTMGQDETHDVGAAIELLHARGLHEVGIMGISLGATIALLAAAEYPDLKAVVADSPYTELAGLISNIMMLTGYLPTVASLTSRLAAREIDRRLDAAAGENNPLTAVNWIAPRPLLIIHGGEDQVADPSGAFALYDAASEPRELWVTPRSAHTASFSDYPREYRERVLGLLYRTFGK